MIPSVLFLLVISAPLPSVTTATTASEDHPSLSRFRLPYEVLIDRTIGTASKSVRFDWRRTTVQPALFISQPADFNNYNPLRAGALVRLPGESLMFELGLSYVWVSETRSSQLLGLTPYRQPGRPSRFELDFSIGFPLAEGVVTAWPSFFPAVEMVFSAYANLRYLIYPRGFGGFTFPKGAFSLLSPRLNDQEIESLDRARLSGMELDRQRYAIWAGFGTDLYFHSGLFVLPRMLIHVPLLAPIAESKMLFGLEFQISVGVAF